MPLQCVVFLSILAAFVLPTFAYAQAQSAAPQPSGTAKAALPPAHVTGRVLRKDATPLAKATVTMLPEGHSAEAQAVRVNSNGVSNSRKCRRTAIALRPSAMAA